jgi:hypothetical protein
VRRGFRRRRRDAHCPGADAMISKYFRKKWTIFKFKTPYH